MIGPLQPAPTSAEGVRLAIIEAWGDNANILYGPESYDFDIISDGIGDQLHFNTDEHIRSLGFRWWKALEAHFYGGDDGRGPVATSAIKYSGNTKVQITFTDDTLPLLPASGLSTSVWRVKNNGTPITVNAADVYYDKVVLTLASASSGTTTVDYAYDNSGEDENVLTDSVTGNTAASTQYLPADPFSAMAVSANPNASISYSGSFTEAGANNGSVTGSIVATLTNDTFVDPLTLNTHITVTNVPAGLTAVVTRDSSTQATITLTGNATSHAAANSISNLTITWLDGAFNTIALADAVTGYQKTDGAVAFDDPTSSLAYSGSFTEAGANDGSVTGSIVATLTDDTFVDPITLNTHVSVSNVPAGLSAVVTRDSDTQVTFTLTGNATSHEAADDVSDLTITWLDGAFTTTATASDVTNYVKNDGVITFDNVDPILSYSGSFSEAGANDGSVTGSIVATLANDTFVDPITLNTHVSVANVPAGLTAVVMRDSDTQVTFTLSGNATSHAAANNVSNLAITWLDGAFTNTATASDVTNYVKNNGSITFTNPTSSGGGGSVGSLVSSSTAASPSYLIKLGLTPPRTPSNLNPDSLNKDKNICPADQLLTQNLRTGGWNGKYDAYTKAIVTQAHILQGHLNRLGFNSGPADGILGPISDGAIKRMQIFLKTIPDGYVGPITRSLINSSCE
ncbi:MAG: peptidoglycan-binding domain-containing protein [Candidatus Paceibacterota bacterium]